MSRRFTWLGMMRLFALLLITALLAACATPTPPPRPAQEQTTAAVPRLTSEELPLLPLYYQVDVYGIRSGLQGVSPTAPGDGWTTFNAHRLYWEK